MMERYFVKSMIYEIARGIRNLESQGIITADKKIILYGLDTFSFAMKTILSNHGFRIDSYITEDEGLRITFQRHVKAVRARYFNSSDGLISIGSIEECLCPYRENILVLSSSKDCPEVKIEELHYEKDKNFFRILDWSRDEFARLMQGKRRLELREVQKLEERMLFELDQFCLDQNLRYWVCGGTLLGTMRHKGFIPWDDDIDVLMPWEDYQQFLREFRPSGDYSLIPAGGSDRRKYYELFSKMADNRTMVREDSFFLHKIHPVAIDIFPLIGLPGGEWERKLFFERYYELEKTIWEDFYANDGDLGVYNNWYPVQEEFLTRYQFDKSDYVGVLATAYKERDCTTKGVYKETLRLPFEDIKVNVPVGYQEYLDNLYGKDWMQLPDDSRRKSHHNMEAYWL